MSTVASIERLAFKVPTTPDRIETSDARLVATWLTDYLGAVHPALGRAGPVCPYTQMALSAGLLRWTVSSAPSRDPGAFKQDLRVALTQLRSLPRGCSGTDLATVIVAFPHASTTDVVKIGRSMRTLLPTLLVHGEMMSFSSATTPAGGLWSVDFRPLYAPVPIVAFRRMVEQDAPFALRNRLLLLSYLARFRGRGWRRLTTTRKRRV